MDQIEESYRRQVRAESGAEEVPPRFTHPDSIDRWRHVRMLDLTRPVWESFPGSVWMTVGDGEYGSDAAYLHSHGVNVVATSLTDKRLHHAFEQRMIPSYRVENAERISVPDDAYDFVLCKEAYHHFPRPPMALYEMIRVCRIAVVLIEPMDDPRFLDGLKRHAKRLIRGDLEQRFETSGNFLYRLSLRELEKLMTAAGGQAIAYRGINDFYHARFAKYDASKVNLGTTATKLGIWAQNILSKLRLLGVGLGCVIVFKGPVRPDFRRVLARAGFVTIDLPRNPYASP